MKNIVLLTSLFVSGIAFAQLPGNVLITFNEPGAKLTAKPFIMDTFPTSEANVHTTARVERFIGRCDSVDFPDDIKDGATVIADCEPKGARWMVGKTNRHLIYEGRLVATGGRKFTIQWSVPKEEFRKDN